LEQHVRNHESRIQYPGNLRASDIALAFGPRQNGFDNGTLAVRIALPYAVLGAAILVPAAYNSAAMISPNAILIALTLSVCAFAKILLSAFFFGMAVGVIRGDTGLAKGVLISTTALLCLLPYIFVQARSVSSALSSGLGMLLLFVTIGFAFDYISVVQHTRAASFRDRLRDFTYLEGLPGLTTFATTLAASAGSAVLSVVSGQTSTLASQAVGLLFPTAASIVRH
jgi:hypothetical protein